MGKRARKRSTGATGPLASGAEMTAPTTTYTDAGGNELELRGSLTLKARAGYAATLSGGLDRDDAWQRATELLFERLAVAWTIAGVRTERQKELLGRYRMAGADERRFVRDSLRAHVAENFPDVTAP
ncbi:MAG: hypothetical protein ACRDLT_05985 [Solirubrobacteraceae bacterium]